MECKVAIFWNSATCPHSLKLNSFYHLNTKQRIKLTRNCINFTCSYLYLLGQGEFKSLLSLPPKRTEETKGSRRCRNLSLECPLQWKPEQLSTHPPNKLFAIFLCLSADPCLSEKLRGSNEALQPPSTLTVKGIQSSMLFDTKPRLQSDPIGWAALSAKETKPWLAVYVISYLLCTLPVLKLPWEAEQGSDPDFKLQGS